MIVDNCMSRVDSDQAFAITLLNPKAIVFYMAFFPLLIDAGRQRGVITFAAMATTIAVLTLAYCVTLVSFADAIGARMKAHRRVVRALRRLAGLFLIGFAVRLAR